MTESEVTARAIVDRYRALVAAMRVELEKGWPDGYAPKLKGMITPGLHLVPHDVFEAIPLVSCVWREGSDPGTVFRLGTLDLGGGVMVTITDVQRTAGPLVPAC